MRVYTKNIGSPSILISHPGRQHSHQVAFALEQQKMLLAYWTGIPCNIANRHGCPEYIWKRLIRYPEADLTPELVTWNPIAPIIKKLTSWLPASRAAMFKYFGFWTFDRWAASQLRLLNQKPDIIIGYENSCLHTFETAKALGIKTVLDAAAVHYQTQDKYCTYREPLDFHKAVIARKNQEIKLADHIVTLSSLARQSYLNSGCRIDQVHQLTLGTDLTLFQPAPHARGKQPFTFMFVGALSLHKGIDLFVQAISKISKDYPDVQFHVAGHSADSKTLAKMAYLKNIKYLGLLSQEQLAKEYKNADCLVLPSRHDSFGMVVVESLASGIPAIVSNRVGAKDLIVDGINGWIVSIEDDFSLSKRMLWCVEHKHDVRLMQQPCRNSVLRFSWATYHQKFVALMHTIL